ncbi:hypothetical protein BDW22DRAFT_1481772 [Trametopsis cervina]|nr:hypothetical protein BDW22DRAFT_1481772 [Trametopsis cervina]
MAPVDRTTRPSSAADALQNCYPVARAIALTYLRDNLSDARTKIAETLVNCATPQVAVGVTIASCMIIIGYTLHRHKRSSKEPASVEQALKQLDAIFHAHRDEIEACARRTIARYADLRTNGLMGTLKATDGCLGEKEILACLDSCFKYHDILTCKIKNCQDWGKSEQAEVILTQLDTFSQQVTLFWKNLIDTSAATSLALEDYEKQSKQRENDWNRSDCGRIV